MSNSASNNVIIVHNCIRNQLVSYEVEVVTTLVLEVGSSGDYTLVTEIKMWLKKLVKLFIYQHPILLEAKTKCATLDPTLLAHNLSSSLSTHDSVSISSSDLSSLPFITIPYEQTDNRLVEQTNVDSSDQRNFNNFINNNISVSVDSVDEDKFDSFLIENDPNKRELIDEEDDDDDEDDANDYNDVGDVQPDYRKSSESLKRKHNELCLNVINHSENTNVTVDNDKISSINLISSIASLSRNVTIPNLQSNSTLKSVLYNGNITGWNVDLAVLLWKRLLGSLGNVNDITIPSLHLVVIEFFSNLTDWLTKIRDNQSVTTDNQSTPDPPLYIPPINHIIPWLYQDVCNNLMKHCTSRFLSTAYPGSSLLVLDFVHTIDKVLSNNTLNKEADQCCSQALALLGSLQIFVNRFKCVLPVFDPSRDSLTITRLPNIKEKMLFMLMSAARKEPFGKSKCTALSSLGIYLYKELNSKRIDEHISEIFDIFLSALQVSDRITNQTASELITLLSDHSHLLIANVPNLVYRIIQDMTKTCCSLLPDIRDATIHPGSKHSASKVKRFNFYIS
ncbi:hypothetical protein HELRODRAFT_172736 [Helobdella robusta]|uniref:Uncharacterized protein n=1 Tax=Helobdella robusta TaxID=6412 RepID=T1F5W0_HELRO|nr:hypothetical protein HELRODRAFT_172736 [Helobdella robusta]ESO04370.1 hypothetical protein HELRODRAFT_172736 [Helobdella robusta]